MHEPTGNCCCIFCCLKIITSGMQHVHLMYSGINHATSGGDVGKCFTLNGNAVKVTSVRNKHADFSWTPWRAVSTAIWYSRWGKNGVEITAQNNDLDNLRGFTTERFCHIYRVMFRLHQAGMYSSLPAILKITPNNRYTVWNELPN